MSNRFWFVIVVYGNSKEYLRNHLFSIISDLNVLTYAPWVLGGDVNDFAAPSKITSISAQASTQCLHFRD